MPRTVSSYTVKSKGVGLPDYAAPAPLGQVSIGPVHTLTDVAELAARLGSIVTYDRRGYVVDFDTFDEPILRWDIALIGASSYAQLDSTYASSGFQCLRMHTGPDLGDSVRIDKGFRQSASSRLGAELAFCMPSTNCLLWIWLENYDGVNYRQALLQVDIGNHRIWIQDQNLDMQLVGDPGIIFRKPFVFHTIKLVADFKTEKYVRLLYDRLEYDISGYSIYKTPSGLGPNVLITANLTNLLAGGGDIWADNLIFTQVEP